IGLAQTICKEGNVYKICGETPTASDANHQAVKLRKSYAREFLSKYCTGYEEVLAAERRYSMLPDTAKISNEEAFEREKEELKKQGKELEERCRREAEARRQAEMAKLESDRNALLARQLKEQQEATRQAKRAADAAELSRFEMEEINRNLV